MNLKHKAGFVSIVGKPNVGKSTLMNRLVGENLSIITAKAQTTRHRIMGIINGDDFQIVYSDTPGILEPKYALHEAMMNYVKVSLEDADVILLVIEWGEKFDPAVHERFKTIAAPILLLINKTDRAPSVNRDSMISYWKNHIPARDIIPVSALTGENVDKIFPALLGLLPEHPAYFPKDELTNRSERFFASEIIREKILQNYNQEIPYSTEVGIEDFKDEENILRIRATIFVERDSQKGIVIGKGGSSLKKVGTEARIDMEAFFGKKVFLETHVKVASDWRKQKEKLRSFGYLE
jgi:GTP-binding protein Era